jgi:hypothetical protein
MKHYLRVCARLADAAVEMPALAAVVVNGRLEIVGPPVAQLHVRLL